MKYRLPIVALSLSMAAWAAHIAVPEGWMPKADIPTKNDRCTNGFGSTFKEDGSPVKCGEVVTPVQAVVRSAVHIAKSEAKIKQCVTGVLGQAEYDILMDFDYQYGDVATCNSSIVSNINTGNYVAACKAYTEYKYLTSKTPTAGWTPYKFDATGKPVRWRFDCSTPGNRVCSGVWKRNLDRQSRCLAAQ